MAGATLLRRAVLPHNVWQRRKRTHRAKKKQSTHQTFDLRSSRAEKIAGLLVLLAILFVHWLSDRASRPDWWSRRFAMSPT
jgi:hypothetical protein